MEYNSIHIKERYNEIADLEDKAERGKSFRVMLPRMFIKKYLTSKDVVLDAAGGTAANAIFMAQLCSQVVLVDLTPTILRKAKSRVIEEKLEKKIKLIEGDIVDLTLFHDESFSFIVCVGAALSYVLDKRDTAVKELIRVAKKESIIIVQVQSKYGMIHNKIRKGMVGQALDIHNNETFIDGLGVKSHLYTVQEITNLLRSNGCDILEVASTPVFTHTAKPEIYSKNLKQSKILQSLEYTYCTKPELLGLGHHILVVAKKSETSRIKKKNKRCD